MTRNKKVKKKSIALGGGSPKDKSLIIDLQ